MSETDDLRKRLEALNRGPLADGADDLRSRIRRGLAKRRGAAAKARAPQAAPEPIVYRRDLPRRKAPPPRPVPEAGPFVALDEAVQGTEIVGPKGGRVFVVERPLGGPEGAWQGLCESLAGALADRRSGAWAQLTPMGLPDELCPEHLIFLDLETTGLGSTPLFLIGTMVWEGGGPLVRQFFARDYSEERAALAAFLELARERRLLVSFNGKSYDVPFLRARAAANGIACRFDPPHLDLLHVGRRLWKHELPDCRLQTLERHVCGRLRDDDIPGAFIPDAYHEYVRTGNAARMATVLEHNFLDLVTLAEILVHMPGGQSSDSGR